MSWADARKRYIDPELERQKKDTSNIEGEKSTPQEEMEAALAAAMALSKGKTTRAEVEASFLASYGKPFPQDVVDRLKQRGANARASREEKRIKSISKPTQGRQKRTPSNVDLSNVVEVDLLPPNLNPGSAT